MRIEERIIVDEIRKRNRNVFEALFHDYYPVLARFAEGFVFDRQACEDIVQNFFVGLWENAESFYVETSIKAYFYQAVKNRCLNYLKSIQVRDKHQILYLEAMLNANNMEEWIDPELSAKIKEAIEGLPPQMAKVFKLKYLEGRKQEDIAEVLDISVNTVKTQLSRARLKLKTLLRESTSINFIL